MSVPLQERFDVVCNKMENYDHVSISAKRSWRLSAYWISSKIPHSAALVPVLFPHELSFS